MYAKAPVCWDIYTRESNPRAVDASIGLVEAARDRRPKPLSQRELVVNGSLAVGFLIAVAALLVTVEPARDADPLVITGLVVLYAVVSRVSFEVGNGFAVPEQIVFIPMLFIAPLPLVPLMVATGFILGELPDYIRGRVRPDRAVCCVSDSWFTLGPVVVLAIGAQGEPATLDNAWLYVAAFAAQVGVGAGTALIGERLANQVPLPDALRSTVWSYRIDGVLSPLGLMVAIQGQAQPAAVLAVVPLVWLLYVFSQERKERYAASVELNQAYRGTVMLLSDVVEAEDDYTAEHCRSVVELVVDVADEMRIPPAQRQELEFAALLHDVGKIAIPKDILNKPSKLTDEEFEVIKQHTIEGQLLLDRVGGLLGRVGKIVRSCHERWDGRGYPDGLAGEEIPLAARIVFCCDAYNAMTTDRPYRQAMSRDDALSELRVNAGTQFDPTVAAAVERVVKSKYPRLVHSAAPSEAVAATLAATKRREAIAG
jgi:HD-GYP domain-containing protein (c-di-GMP phosphodiesterase class II)